MEWGRGRGQGMVVTRSRKFGVVLRVVLRAAQQPCRAGTRTGAGEQPLGGRHAIVQRKSEACHRVQDWGASRSRGIEGVCVVCVSMCARVVCLCVEVVERGRAPRPDCRAAAARKSVSKPGRPNFSAGGSSKRWQTGEGQAAQAGAGAGDLQPASCPAAAETRSSTPASAVKGLMSFQFLRGGSSKEAGVSNG